MHIAHWNGLSEDIKQHSSHDVETHMLIPYAAKLHVVNTIQHSLPFLWMLKLTWS
jgi:hypothetical protein